jgi:hypothetical protein
MDNRCPLCGKDLGRKKLAYAVMVRMELDCPHCAGALRRNVHRGEIAIVFAGTGTALALFVLSVQYRSQALLLAALGIGAAAAVAEFALERLWLRRWPRYVQRRAPVRME